MSDLEISTEYESINFHIYSSEPEIQTGFERFEETTSSVILSDGSKWKIIKDQKDETIRKIIAQWEKQDDIRLKSSTLKGETFFAMKNVRTKDLIFVQSSKECADLSKAFFLSEIDPSGYALKTSDGRTWVTGFLGHFSSRHWEENSRVVINQSIHQGQDYEIIHPENGESIWATNVFRKA